MRVIAIFTAAAVVLATGPALAAGADRNAGPNTEQVTVRLNDLDLATVPGAKSAIARLKRAAADACGNHPSVSPDLIRLSDAYQRCRSAALEAAVSQIHTTAVAEAFAEVRGQAVRLAKR